MFEKNNSAMSSKSTELHVLLAESQGAIRSYILSLTADIHVTNDVLQETNLVICKKESDFKRGSNFVAWARRIAYFEVLRHRKSASRDKLVFDDALIELLTDEADRESEFYKSRKSALSLCVRKLSEANQKLVLKRYYDGVSVEKLAEDQNCKANAISQKLFRIRTALLKCIKHTMVDNIKA